MFWGDGELAIEIGNGTGHAKNTIVSACGKPQRFHRGTQDILATGTQGTVLAYLSAAHSAIEPKAVAAETLLLHLPGPKYLLTQFLTADAIADHRRVEIRKRNSGHLHMEIDAIQQGAADFSDIAFDGGGCTLARSARIAQVAARAGIHRCHQNEMSRERGSPQGSTDGNPAFFQGLSKYFQCRAIEFRKFIQKENRVVVKYPIQ